LKCLTTFVTYASERSIPASQHHLGLARPLAEDGLRAGLPQRARPTASRRLAQLRKRGAFGDERLRRSALGHDDGMRVRAAAKLAQVASRSVKLLVHLATGPEHATRAALALLVARTAVSEGHDVRVFLAGDAVQLVRPETADAVHGVGTGAFGEHWSALLDAGVPVFISGLSSKARGVSAVEGVEPAPPEKLVELAAWADSTLTY
jgi:predicted peroxiredoxin